MRKFEVGDMINLKYTYAYSPTSTEPAIVLQTLRGGYKVLFSNGVYEISSDYAHESYQLLSKIGAKSLTDKV